MTHPLALAAIRSQPWAIMPDWLAGLEGIASGALMAEAVQRIARDGHIDRQPLAIAAMGGRLEGARMSTIRDGVAAIPLFGPTFARANMMTDMSGATSLDIVATDLRAALASDAVRKIVLVVDSPGGTVAGTAEFAALLASSSKPVTAHISGLGASAAYWIASQASEIVMDRVAMVGSIGVVSTGAAQETPDGDGNRYYDITSSNAENKRPDFGTPEGRDKVRAQLDQIERVFVADVAKGRGTTAKAVLETFGRGGLLVGKDAVSAGMADRIGSLDETLTRLARGGGGGRSPRADSHDDQLPIAAKTTEHPALNLDLAALAWADLDLRRRRANWS